MAQAKTRLSSKGQVVIPAWVRRKLDLSPGEELSVEIIDGKPPTIVLRGSFQGEMTRLLERGYRWIERTGEDLVGALHEARRKERAQNQRTHRRP